MMNSSPPYSALTPDCALDALDATGFKADGRLLALNSYENRVYQMGVEDAAPARGTPPDTRPAGAPAARRRRGR